MRELTIVTVKGHFDLPHTFSATLFAHAVREANLEYPGRLATFHRWRFTSEEPILMEKSLVTL